MKKVITIDLWGTLIKNNPEFKKERIKLVQCYNKSLTEQEIETGFKAIGDSFNLIIETSGWQPEKETIILVIKGVFKFDKYHQAFSFYNDYQSLAIMNPPLLYSQETRKYLNLFSKKYALVVSSNTLLLEGSTMHNILLYKLQISKYFQGFNFSSDLHVSKPSRKMFKLADLKNYRKEFASFHIGDNLLTDKNVHGIPCYLINSNSKTIEDAYKHIITKI